VSLSIVSHFLAPAICREDRSHMCCCPHIWCFQPAAVRVKLPNMSAMNQVLCTGMQDALVSCRRSIYGACRFAEPDWIHDRSEPFLQRRDRLPEPAEEPPKLGIRDFMGMHPSVVSPMLQKNSVSGSWPVSSTGISSTITVLHCLAALQPKYVQQACNSIHGQALSCKYLSFSPNA